MMARGAGMFNSSMARLGSMGRKSSEASRGWRSAAAQTDGSVSVGNNGAAYRDSISRGRRRAMYGGGGLFALGMANSSRSPKGRSSGSGGLAPHSSGAQTFL